MMIEELQQERAQLNQRHNELLILRDAGAFKDVPHVVQSEINQISARLQTISTQLLLMQASQND